MAVTNFEEFSDGDTTTTRTLLHEAIPLTGAIVSGTYGTFPNEENIKNYAHGMFQSVYDYPYLSSSANHIFDATMGFDEASVLSASAASSSAGVMANKKSNMYNQLSQVLLGYTGAANSVSKFESDLTMDLSGTMHDCFFLNFSRLLAKDQIKKGSFSLTLGTGSWDNPFGTGLIVLTDASASDTGGTAPSLGGDYGVLYASGGVDQGLVFYQAGIVVLTGSVFGGDLANPTSILDFMSGTISPMSGNGALTWQRAFTSASMSGTCDALRHRIQNISFNNTTEINSKIYFCRVPSTAYNHSSNPTYLNASKIRVKSVATDSPIAYITTIGLYDSANQLMAVAKLSEPLRKDPTNELTLRVRLDY